MAKAKNGKTKKPRERVQPEIPGTERPVDPDLFTACGDFLDASDECESATARKRDARATVTELLKEKAASLEEDKHGNPTYVFQDGERSRAFHLVTGQKVTVEILESEG
jgi:hypothetical protein